MKTRTRRFAQLWVMERPKKNVEVTFRKRMNNGQYPFSIARAPMANGGSQPPTPTGDDPQ